MTVGGAVDSGLRRIDEGAAWNYGGGAGALLHFDL